MILGGISMSVVCVGLPPSRAAAQGIFEPDVGPEQLLQSLPHDDVLVLVDSALATTDPRRVGHMVRFLEAHDHIAVIDLPVPVTRACLVADLLAHAAGREGVSDLVPAALELERAMRTRATLGGVSRLSRPAPTVLQHLRGWLPGARFQVDWDQSTVTASAASLQAEPAPAALWAVAGRGGTWGQATPAEATVEAGSVWGETSFVEVSWLTAPPEEVIAHARAGAPACTNCGRLRPPTRCLFCGACVTADQRTHPVVPDPTPLAPAVDVDPAAPASTSHAKETQQ